MVDVALTGVHATSRRLDTGFVAVASVGSLTASSGAGTNATLWVDGVNGNDNNTIAQVRAGGGSVAWQTIGRAAWGSANRATPNTSEAASAGDTVLIAAGTYAFTGVVDDRFNATYSPANSGTAGNPITFLAGGTVTLTAPNTLSPVIGTYSRNYITWSGPFSLDEANIDTKPDTGPVAFIGSTGCVLDGATIIGTPGAVIGDNHNGVRLEGAVSCTIKNCTLHDWWDGTGQNGTLFTLYGSSNCIIEHNRGYNAGCAVYFKDTAIEPLQSGNHVRYNYFSNVTNAFFRWSHVSGGPIDGSFVYQNLCVDAGASGNGMKFIGALNDWVFNNTFVTCAAAVSSGHPPAMTGIRVWNNIFENCGEMIHLDSGTLDPASAIDIQHNCYHTYSTFYSGGDGNLTFASYKATYTDKDQTSPISVDSDPLFVGTGDRPYNLQSGSPARNLAADLTGFDMTHSGCYQTGTEDIGLEA